MSRRFKEMMIGSTVAANILYIFLFPMLYDVWPKRASFGLFLAMSVVTVVTYANVRDE